MLDLSDVNEDWLPCLSSVSQTDHWLDLDNFLKEERETYDVYPPVADVFRAIIQTPLSQVRAVILGQDPYHDIGQAHGLAFSVLDGVKPPPSLNNIFIELNHDIGISQPNSGNLVRWADNGVLLLNTVLTVRAHQPASHRGRGWEVITDSLIRAVSARPDAVAFVLWGSSARSKKDLLDDKRHLIIESPHPSPLSAYRGFFGSRPFSRVNTFLAKQGREPIEWRL